jgi:predicted metal-dependent HD superfamily phosphohydrolase
MTKPMINDPHTINKKRFTEAWLALGATRDNAFYWLDFQYQESHRYYHNLEHIEECLGWLDQVSHLVQRRSELEVAIWFHDAIYAPYSLHNEALSAKQFSKLATKANMTSAAILRISDLIRATIKHDATEGDAAYLNDIDLSILGSAPIRFQRYERDIRKEYSSIPEVPYKEARANILAGLLDRPKIYQTPYFARLETQARENLSQ